MRDNDFKFGIPDSSMIKIRIYSYDEVVTILNISFEISKGCYYLNWISQNFERMKTGMYYCSFEAYPYTLGAPIFKKKLPIVITK